MLEYQLEINRLPVLEGYFEPRQHDVLSATFEGDLAAGFDLESFGSVPHSHHVSIDGRFVKHDRCGRGRTCADQSIVSLRMIDDPEIDHPDGGSGAGMRNCVGDLDPGRWGGVRRINLSGQG